jgi:chromosome segregation ATPase
LKKYSVELVTRQLGLLALLYTSSTVVLAADLPKDKQVHRMQLQLNAIQQEKVELVNQVDMLKKQLSEAETKRSALERKLGSQSKQVSELTEKQLKVETEDKKQQNDLTEKFQASEKQLKLVTQELADTTTHMNLLKTEHSQEKKRLEDETQVCEKKNTELYALNSTLMDKYQKKGIIEALRQAEPFTQLEKVKMEILIQEYRDKSDASLIVPQSNVAQGVQRP